MLIGIARELGVNGQKHRRALFHGKLDGKLHALGRARLGGDVLLVLARRQNLGQDGLELDLAQDTARLDVAQHALEVAHARGDALHVAQPAIYGLELLAHLLKRGRKPVVQRARELLVHRRAHLLQLHRVVATDARQLRLHRLTYRLQSRIDRIAIRA